ncbi:hypothetical protein [Synechococcus sp. PCC 7335]|uniref:hypothetical protein n=1 Tax=Synechococcus sp. (strain ATCC 29403 / PCC 7335) TaxID=91464 RepID=UPI0012FB17D2|nr:hypothetical protein [Synechococcus sp. PCC 7335]
MNWVWAIANGTPPSDWLLTPLTRLSLLSLLIHPAKGRVIRLKRANQCHRTPPTSELL